MVMDYLDGHTLAEELRSGPLPLERALQIGQQLAAALEDVHQAGIVHCDLKPEHVIIQEGGRRIKLIDFGVARSSLPLEEAEAGDSSNPFSAVAVESLIVGTPRYVAPEQARGEPTSERADIYSLGVVLYQMLTGRYPYEEMDTEQLGRTSFIEPQPMGRLADGSRAPAELESLVRRCLAWHPGQRVQRVSEIALALDALSRPQRLRGEATAWARGRAFLRATTFALAGLAAGGLPLGLAFIEGSQTSDSARLPAPFVHQVTGERLASPAPPPRRTRARWTAGTSTRAKRNGSGTGPADRRRTTGKAERSRGTSAPRSKGPKLLEMFTIDPFSEPSPR
jgi:hypothetical protein